jgi:IPT/TIG domain
MASLGGAVALMGAGLAGLVGLAVTSNPAGADTQPFNVTCTVAGQPPSTAPATVTGSISSPAPGGSVSVNGLSLNTTFSSTLLSAIVGDTVSGTISSTLTATGTTQASQPVTYTINPVVVPSGATSLQLIAPGVVSPFTANASGTVAVFTSTDPSSISLSITGIGTVTGSCTAASAEQIASAPIEVPAGTINAVLPNSGPVAGGSRVTIHGANLGNPTAVTFGGVPAVSFVGKTNASITAVSPPSDSAKTVDVQVTTSAGTSTINPGDHFTYTAGPIVTDVSPNTGPPSGGTLVAITGFQLSGATAVAFGSTPATGFTVNSATSITATAPAGTGVVDVTVTSPTGVSITSQLDQFNYRAGYWLVASDGGVFSYGNVPFEGSAGSIKLNKPVVDMAATPDNGGYWLVASDGGVFAYGDTVFYGSTGGMTLNKPIVDIARTPDGLGYWLVASDGGVFAYGDAAFDGSHGGSPLNQPIVAMAPTPDGGGYWLVASDGGVFAYGDATFHGSHGGSPLNKPVEGIAPTPDGGGYWLVASDGGVFAYGDAVFEGSHGGSPLNKPVVRMASTPDGGGYWLVASDGGIFAYGDAVFYGSHGGSPLNKPVVGMAGAGSATANAATISVLSIAPVVTTQPVSQTVASGGTLTFSAAASGAPTPTVEWQYSDDHGSTWVNVPSLTTPSFTTPPLTSLENGWQVRAVFTNGTGSATTNAATVTVT